MSEQKMTVSQALSEGYTHWVYDQDDRLFRLDEINEIDLLPKNLLLIEKQPSYISVDHTFIQDSVINDLIDSSETCPEEYVDDIENDLKRIDGWSELADKINDALKKYPVYYPTKIQLIPD